VSTAEERRWYAAVHTIDCCVICHTFGIQCAHRNEGKGMGLKTKPWMTAALCPSCHFEVDSGRTLDREHRRALMDRAIVLTHARLIERGLLRLA